MRHGSACMSTLPLDNRTGGRTAGLMVTESITVNQHILSQIFRQDEFLCKDEKGFTTEWFN